MKFISPFITPKNYKTTSQNYYVTLSPQNNNQYISLTITENRYETKDRNIEGYGKIISLDSEQKKVQYYQYLNLLAIIELLFNFKHVFPVCK